MGGISKSANVADGIEVDEESFFPDEEQVKAKAELIYNDAYKILRDRQAKDEAEVHWRIENPSIAEEVKAKIFECIYNYVGYGRSLFHLNDDSYTQSAKKALGEAEKILAAIDAIPLKTSKAFLNGRSRGGTIFSVAVRRSVVELLAYCSEKGARSFKPKGRPGDDVLEVITEDVVKIFEFWVGRGFKKTVLVAGGKGGKEEFVGGDTACIYSLLKGIDPSITTARARTALKKVTPRVQK